MLVGIVVEQPHCALAVPELQGGGLVLALAVRLLHFQDDVLAVGRHRRRHDDRGDPALEGLAEDKPSALDQARAGQRYASACRFLSDGSFSRTERSRARSSSAVMTVSSSGACASTIPHGSTISDRPYAGLPGSVSPTWAGAAT